MKGVTPRCTLADVCGAGLFYDARPSGRASAWLAPDRCTVDTWTGAQLAIAGGMPTLANRGAVTEEGLALLRDAGLDLPPRLEVFDGESSYLALLRDLASTGTRFVIQHVHPPDELDPKAYWIPRALLAFLNSKLHLDDLVPRGSAPRREVVPVGALEGLAERLPFVAKAATEEPTGAGVDVAICRRREDLARAARRFHGLDAVIVEEFLAMERSLCLHFATTAAGQATYLGSTEQVCDEEGTYQGNWIGGLPAPRQAIALGQAIVEKGAALGYRGFAGIDVALLGDGRPLAYDLNFRVCGSTAPLLLFESVAGPGTNAIGRSRWWTGRGSFTDLVRAARDVAAKGDFLPLATFDPEAGGLAGVRPRIFGLLLGESREAVLERERDLAALGLG